MCPLDWRECDRGLAVELNDSASPNRWRSIHTRVIKQFYGWRSWFFPPKEIWMWHRISGSICIILPVHVLLTFDFGVFVLLLLRNAFLPESSICVSFIHSTLFSASGYSLPKLRHSSSKQYIKYNITWQKTLRHHLQCFFFPLNLTIVKNQYTNM